MITGIGRFLQTDPTGFDGGDMNLFRYCADDPVDMTDPMGLAFVGLISSGKGAWVSGSDGITYEDRWRMGDNRGNAPHDQPAGMDKLGGNWNDPNIKNHIRDQRDPGSTLYVNKGDGRPTLDWWVRPGFEDKKVILGELEHVSRYLWFHSKDGDLAAAIRKHKPSGDSARKDVIANAVRQERQWHRNNLHGSGRHALDRNPELWKTMSQMDIKNAIQNVKPLQDPRPQYLGY